MTGVGMCESPPQSTSGYLVPGYYAFAKNGVDPIKHFKSCRNGNHESNALAVANKQVDAATFNTEAMFKLENNKPDAAKQLKSIWKGPLIASDPMVVRRDLDPAIKQKVVSFFITYGQTAEQKARIAPLKWSGFRASSNDQLLPYRQLSLVKEKAKIEADTQMSSEDKTTKMQKIEAMLVQIAEQIAKADKAMAGK